MPKPSPDQPATAIPSFATTMRGYDRMQVDDYIDMLQESLSEAQVRMLDAEDGVSKLRAQVEAAAVREPAVQKVEAELQTQETTVRGIADSVTARVHEILAAAEETALTLTSEAATDRANARTLLDSAESEARMRAETLIAEARDTVDRLARRAEIERSRRDTARQQIAALRATLDGIDTSGTGEIDLVSVEQAAREQAPGEPAPVVQAPVERATGDPASVEQAAVERASVERAAPTPSPEPETIEASDDLTVLLPLMQ